MREAGNTGERNDVRDRIERSDFVEAHVFGRHPVDFSLGDGDALENAERVLFHERRKLAGRDELPDFAMIAAVMVRVRMFVNFMAVPPIDFGRSVCMRLVFVRMRS